MKTYDYLIIGGGMTADAAVKGIREVDNSGTIGVICAEADPPYSRPPLTKGLWKSTPEEKIWKHTSAGGADVLLNLMAVKINKEINSVEVEGGEIYKYGKLLLATGGKVRKLPFGYGDVIYYRTFADYRKLRELAKLKNRFLIIGGGFIGSEIAAALAMNNKEVTIVFPGTGIGDRVFPKELSDYITEFFTGKGVNIIAGENIVEIVASGDTKLIKTDKGRIIEADCVLAGIGISPETSLAEETGLTVDNGIIVDEELRTNVHNIFAAGDAANFYNPALGKRIRVEHEDNALQMGKQAGRNMAGSLKPYVHLPFFYSDLFSLGYEAVGELNSTFDIFEDWSEKFEKGAIYYLQNGRVRGVLLWNVWKKLDEARALISEVGPVDINSLKGRIA